MLKIYRTAFSGYRINPKSIFLILNLQDGTFYLQDGIIALQEQALYLQEYPLYLQEGNIMLQDKSY